MNGIPARVHKIEYNTLNAFNYLLSFSVTVSFIRKLFLSENFFVRGQLWLSSDITIFGQNGSLDNWYFRTTQFFRTTCVRGQRDVRGHLFCPEIFFGGSCCHFYHSGQKWGSSDNSLSPDIFENLTSHFWFAIQKMSYVTEQKLNEKWSDSEWTKHVRSKRFICIQILSLSIIHKDEWYNVGLPCPDQIRVVRTSKSDTGCPRICYVRSIILSADIYTCPGIIYVPGHKLSWKSELSESTRCPRICFVRTSILSADKYTCPRTRWCPWTSPMIRQKQ